MSKNIMCPILPPEMWENVIKYSFGPIELKNLSSVSRMFRQLSKREFRRRSIKLFGKLCIDKKEAKKQITEGKFELTRYLIGDEFIRKSVNSLFELAIYPFESYVTMMSHGLE